MSSHQSTLSRRSGSVLSLVLAAAAFVSAACGRGGAPAQPQGPPPATGVQLLKLENKPIEDASEFIATLRSLRSATVQPEIEGTITQIFVKSGQRVKVGTPLIQVNQAKEQAAQSSTNAGGEAKVTEPIRNRGAKVGRNDPCPCGSGKKYKNCHMRQQVG